jgi:hypothetical protein
MGGKPSHTHGAYVHRMAYGVAVHDALPIIRSASHKGPSFSLSLALNTGYRMIKNSEYCSCERLQGRPSRSPAFPIYRPGRPSLTVAPGSPGFPIRLVASRARNLFGALNSASHRARVRRNLT